MRGLADALPEHPALAELSLRAGEDPYIGNVAECVEKSGEAATAEALEAVLAGTFGLLARLIGKDMATNLIERSLPESATIKDPEKKRAEA